jgi:hypothetical protein
MTDLHSRPLPPGNLGLPIVGETLAFFRESDFQQRRHERYGPIFKWSSFRAIARAEETAVSRV